MTKLALPITVYTNGSDCTNDGISGKYETLLLVHDEGWVDIDGTEGNLVEVITHMGNPIIVPLHKPENMMGPAMGGNYATGDSRFMEIIKKVTGVSFYGAVPIHDRFETWEMYNSMSL